MARRQSTNAFAELGRQWREAFDEARADWRLGETGKFLPRPSGVSSTGSNADWHWRDQGRYFLGVERARSWDRNNLVVAQGLDRLCDNVLGEEGPQLNPLTPDPGLNKELRNRFYAWANDPLQADYTGQSDLWELGRLALRQTCCDGDILTLPLREGPLQMLENHRLRTPYNTNRNVVLGVMVDDRNRAQEYWVTKSDVGVMQTIRNVGDMQKLPAFGADQQPAVFHMKLPRRISQTRGVSLMAPVADAIGMHDDLQFAKLVQAQIVSCFAFIEKWVDHNAPAPPPMGGSRDAQEGIRTTTSRGDGSEEVSDAIGPGMRKRPPRGLEITPWSPNTPNAEFFPHAMMIMSFIAVNLKMPVAVLLMDPSNTNFSGWRGAMDEARKGFRYLQGRLNNSFFSPVYRWKIAQLAAEEQSLRARMEEFGPQFFAHAWQNPAWDYIEPLKDSQADALQLATSLTSHRRRCAKRNILFEELAGEIVEDNALLFEQAIVRAKAINERHELEGSDRISWRELARSALPQGMSMQIDTREEPEPAAEPAAKEDQAK